MLLKSNNFVQFIKKCMRNDYSKHARNFTSSSSIDELEKSNEKLSEENNKKKNNSDGDSNAHFQLKTAKGTKDFNPYQMEIREKLFEKITSCFKLHGAVTIDTPVFERKEILTQKYGEESKLIYDLADQQGEILSLRYDLTVPFARYLVMNKIKNIKRYQIGKVYRREQLSHAKGRLREFFQCDFDIAGSYDKIVPDSECLKIISEILDKLEFKNHILKINHRQLLSSIYEICQVPKEKFNEVSSTIDKLDKIGWDGVKEILLAKSGISESVFEKIKSIVNRKGSLGEIIDFLKSKKELQKIEAASVALSELELLNRYCDILKINNKIEFDLSLARGLDYYTGIIFEAVLIDGEKIEDKSFKSLGSVAGGGRYDGLTSMFDPKFKLPCVGLSIGVERLFTILETKYLEQVKCLKQTNAQVYVATPMKRFMEEKLSLCEELWRNNIRTEFSYKSTGRFLSQLNYCEETSIPFCVIIGDDEIKNNVVKLRNVKTKIEETICRGNLINELQKKIKELN